MFDFLFHFSALLVLPFWFLMIFLPKSEFTEKIVRPYWIIIPPTICYLIFLETIANQGCCSLGKPGGR